MRVVIVLLSLTIRDVYSEEFIELNSTRSNSWTDPYRIRSLISDEVVATEHYQPSIASLSQVSWAGNVIESPSFNDFLVSTNEVDRGNLAISSVTIRKQILLSYIPTPQNQVGINNANEWGCGLSSMSRITKELGYPDTFEDLARKITPYDIEAELNLCEYLGLGTASAWTYVVCVYSFKLANIRIGNPAPRFVDKINAWAGRTVASSEEFTSPSDGLNRIRSLLDQNKPVIVNVEDELVPIGFPSKNLGPFGWSPALNLANVPGQHYIVIYGYDDDGVYYHDTDASSGYKTNAEFLKDWSWANHGYGRYDNIVTMAMWQVGSKPLTLIYFLQAIPTPSPGCDCSCCCTSCFCLVPCGCACKVPTSAQFRYGVRNQGNRELYVAITYVELSPHYYNSAFSDWGYEGKWRTNYWFSLSPGQSKLIASSQSRTFYLYAVDPTSGVYYGSSGAYSTYIEGKLIKFDSYTDSGGWGDYSIYFDTSKITLSPNYRIFVNHNSDYVVTLFVLVYYYDMDSSSWMFKSVNLKRGDTYYIGRTTNTYWYAYAQSTDGYFFWSGSDSMTYYGQSYNMFRTNPGNPIREYTYRFYVTSCTPQNCAWGSWSSYSVCRYNSQMVNSPSGGFVQYRTRSVAVARNGCGKDCDGYSTEYQACTDPCKTYSTCATCSAVSSCGWCSSTSTCVSGTASGPTAGTCSRWDFGGTLCPVNCVVSSWSSWSTCSRSCDYGTQYRTRYIITNPKNGGSSCPVLREEQSCIVSKCTPVPTHAPTQPPDGSLQMVSFTENNEEMQGRLDIYYSGDWGTICNVGFSNKSATVACKQILGPEYEGLVVSNKWDSLNSERILVKGVSCDGHETTLMDCFSESWGNIGSCTHDDDVAVSCSLAIKVRGDGSDSKSGSATSMIIGVVVAGVVVVVICGICLCCREGAKKQSDVEFTPVATGVNVQDAVDVAVIPESNAIAI